MTILDARRYRPLEGGPSFSISNRLFRLIWRVSWLLLAAWTPRQAAPWRRLVLQAFGARLAATADVRGSAQVWYPPNLVMGPHSTLGPGVICYNMASVEIGTRAMISQRAHLCTGTHDLSDPDFQLVARRIVIESRSWIAAEAFVGPGVRVREGAVLGARAAAFDDLNPWWVYRGNPACPVKQRAMRGGKCGALAS